MINALNWDFWSSACFETNGGGGGGGGDRAPSSSPRPTARPDRPAPAPTSDRDDGPSPQTFDFQGPTPGGTAGYTQDVSRIGVDPFTGFLTGDDDDDRDVGMTTGTPLDTSVGIENLLPPPPPPGPRATDIYDDGGDDFVYQGPTFTGPGYTQDVSQMDVDEDTGFITDDRGVDYTPPPAVAVDEFSGLLPSMTDQYYVPPSVSTSLIGTGDPVLDAISRATTTPTFTYNPLVDPLTNPLGQQPTQQSDLVGQLVRGSILTTQLGARGIESLAESIAPQSQATIGYGEGQIDPGLARAAGYSGNEPIAVGDRNIISRAAGRVAEDLGRLTDRAFTNLSPAEREALTADILGEEGVNLDALRAQTLSALVPTVASITPLGLGAGLGPTMIVGGLLTAGETAEDTLANVRNYARANNLTPQETAALESQVLEYNAPAGFGTGAAGQLIFGAPIGSVPARIAAGVAEEALQEGYVEPQVSALASDIALGTDTFGRQFDPNAAIVGGLLGGGANVALGGGDTSPASTSRTAPTQPAQPAPPVAPTTPGIIQIPGTNVVVNTAPVVPMTQAPTLQTPAPLGTGGTFLPGVTQQGAIITPAAPARPALPAPDAQPTADLQTAADIIDTGLARDQGIGSETFRAIDEATGGRLNMMDVQAIMEQRMAERNADQAFDPEAAFARLQARFPGAQTVADTAATQGLPATRAAVDLQTAADIIDAGLARDNGIGSETFQAVDEATGGRLNMMDVQAIMEQRMAERNAAAAFDPEAAFARLQARFPGARLAEPAVSVEPPAQPAFDPEAALERLRTSFPGIRTVADTTITQEAPTALEVPAVDSLPSVAPTTSVARTEGVTQQPVEEYVFEGEVLPPLTEVSAEVTPPQEGEVIDQAITRDVAVQTQPPVPPETAVSTPPTTPTGVFVNIADELPIEDEGVSVEIDEEVGEEADTGGREEEAAEVSVGEEDDEDGECPPGYIRQLVDGQLVCVPEEEEVLEEEEPPFECPPGFRRVQMANGGFTCVPETARPRVGPFTQTVDVSGLTGRTVFRPGTRSR